MSEDWAIALRMHMINPITARQLAELADVPLDTERTAGEIDEFLGQGEKAVLVRGTPSAELSVPRPLPRNPIAPF